MYVLKQRGSDVVFIRGTFISNIHQDPSILLTLHYVDVNDDDDDDTMCVTGVHVCIHICIDPLGFLCYLVVVSVQG